MFPLNVSLRTACLTKIAVALCCKGPVIRRLPNVRGSCFYVEINETLARDIILTALSEVVSELRIPETLKTDLTEAMNFVLMRISQWKKKNAGPNLLFRYVMKNLHLLEFSNIGEIDEESTVRRVLKIETLHVQIRYFIACYYAIEDEVIRLREFTDGWIIPENILNHPMLTSPIAVYWRSRNDILPVENEAELLRRLFFFAVEEENLSAMKYFLSKIPENLKQDYILDAAKKLVADKKKLKSVISSLSISFVISNLNETKQRELFREYSFNIMLFYLTVSETELFPVVAHNLLGYTSNRNIFILMFFIVNGYSRDVSNSQDSFRVVWDECSIATKHYIVQEIIGSSISGSFLFMASLNEQNFQMLRNFASPQQRKEMQDIRDSRHDDLLPLLALALM